MVNFDNAADLGDNNGASSSLTAAFTCRGSQRILYVGFLGDNVSGGLDDITGVTYAGVAMTFVAKKVDDPVAGARMAYLYALLNPANGSNNVVISAGSTHFILAGAVSYTGASTLPDASAATNSGTAGDLTYTTALTTVKDSSWVVLFEQGYDNNLPPGAGSGSIRRTFGATYGNWGFFDSGLLITPSRSYSMNTTRGGGGGAIDILHIMATVPALPEPASYSTFPKFLLRDPPTGATSV